MGVAGVAAGGAALSGGGELTGREDRGTESVGVDDDPLRVGPPQHPATRIPPPGVDRDPLRVGPPRRPGRPSGDPL